MWKRVRRSIVTAVVVTAVAAAMVAPAMAQTGPPTEAPQAPDLEERRATILEGIAQQADRLAERVAFLDQAADRLGTFASDVASATTQDELRAVVESARADLGDLRDAAKQSAYTRLVAHVGADVEKFTDGAQRLAAAVEIAASRGIDTAAAESELAAAYTAIDAAAAQLAGLPAEAGDAIDDLMPVAREAHATVHEGQAHLRAARSLLVGTIGGPRPPGSNALAF